MILLVLRGKLKRFICRMFGHRLDLDYSEYVREVGVYDPGDFCNRCGHWL